MKHLILFALLIIPAISFTQAFAFPENPKPSSFTIMNDGVMGGLSEGYIEQRDASMTFYGTLSLENNGGFSWCRSTPMSVDLSKSEALKLRVKGDGRKYSVTIETPRENSVMYYYTDIQTIEGEWQSYILPLEDFELNIFGNNTGRTFDNNTKVERIGIILADKKAGKFEVEIEQINAVPQSTSG